MRFFLISDNIDTRAGMRLAGIEGVVVHKTSEVLDAVDRAVSEPGLGIILITEKLARLIPDRMSDLKLSKLPPLIVEIPDRHGTTRQANSITRYVNESIGLKI